MKRWLPASLCAALLLAVSYAQAEPMNGVPSMSGMTQGSKSTMQGSGGMMQMSGMMQKMQADTKAMDDELDGLVVTMNQATGSAKTDAMAAVITKMAQQRRMMDQKMAAMQKSMMMGMMGNGMMGGMGSGMKMPTTPAQPMTMDPSMMMPRSK